MPFFTKPLLSLVGILILSGGSELAWAQPVRVVDDRQLPNGQAIEPAGELLAFGGRPVDLALSADGKWLFAKDRNSLRIFSVADWKLRQTVTSPGGASLWGLAVSRDNRVYFTNAQASIHVFAPNEESDENNSVEEPFRLERSIALPANSFPCGIELSDDQSQAYVCLSKMNAVAIVDLKSARVTDTIDVGIAPFDLQVQESHLIVSNIGGRRPEPADTTAPSAGSPTVVDARGVASTGTVSVIDLATRVVSRQIPVGLHPSVMSPGLKPHSTLVCNTNDDSVSFVDALTGQTQNSIVKPDAALPFGSMPSAVHLLVDRNMHAVALAGNNAIALLQTNADGEAKMVGMIPTAWYPVAIESDDKYLYVACVKGIGSRNTTRPAEKGRNSHDHLGTVQRISLTRIFDSTSLPKWTEDVRRLSRVQDVLEARRSVAKSQVAAKPIPDQLGEPSLFRHVIYVIKENRTFDQVFGDVVEATSEPSLCVFPEKVTPNHHALARRFGLLDNYYCNGVLSADGHSWATEGNVTPYLERAFGGFARSYTFGNDPITYSSTGFVWDHVLSAGLSFRNYGEMDYAKPPATMKYQEIWSAFAAGEPIEFEQNIGVERLRRYSCRDYPGWNMTIPDVLRMDRFLKEFRKFETQGNLPNFTIIYLPQDHLGGGVTSEAHMADNDLAVGQLVDAVSHSPLWKDTVIFINEDDPQNGYDHIDGHRSLCLVISAYSKPGVHHNFYNQTSVLRTMLHILGLPPMNQQDAAQPLMAACFQDTPSLEPYSAIAANYPLNQTAAPKEKQSAIEQHWRSILATVPIERTGMKTETDEENLNRFVWHEVRGWEVPYPQAWSGAHGKGLGNLGLKHGTEADEEVRNDIDVEP